MPLWGEGFVPWGLTDAPLERIFALQVQSETFSAWLAERVGDGPGKISRRELGRRLAAKHPEDGGQQRLIDAQRRNVRRILAGQKATQATRDAICDALDLPRDSAPSVEDEDEETDLVEALFRRLGPELRRAVHDALEVRA